MTKTLFAVKLSGTTDASGDLTVTAGFDAPAWLEAVEWFNVDFTAGVDAVLSCVDTESAVDQTLLTLTNADSDAWYRPRETHHDNAGVDQTATDDRAIINGTLQLVISDGGDSKSGGAIVYYFK